MRLKAALLVLFGAVATALLLVGAAPARHDVSRPPEVFKFDAEFLQEIFSTRYTVYATDPDGDKLTYKWTKTQPGETCGLFRSSGRVALWRHPHKSQMDPVVPEPLWCEDSQQAGGHAGTITVVVADRQWACTYVWPYGSLSTEEVLRAGKPIPESAKCVGPPTTPTTKSTATKLTNPVADPTVVWKKVCDQTSKEAIEIAKKGGLLALIPGQTFIEKALGLGGKSDTFLSKLLGKGSPLSKNAEAVVKTIAGGSIIGLYLGGYYYAVQAQDPPRRDYTVIARPARRSASVPAAAAAGLPKRIVDAVNALLANSARFKSVSAALLTTFERVQGAYAAKSILWEGRRPQPPTSPTSRQS